MATCTKIASVATELVASPTAVALRRIAHGAMLGLLCAAPAADDATSANADVATLENARSALKKGMHNKAFEKFRELYRADPVAAWAHAEVQEGLCVCSAKLKKEKVAASACANASDLFAAEQRAVPLALALAVGEARLMAGDAAAAAAAFRDAVGIATRGEALRQEKEARDGLRRAERQLFASFSRQRGSVAPTSFSTKLGTQVVESIAEAIEACADTAGCRAVSLPLLSKLKDGACCAPTKVSLYNTSILQDDEKLPPSRRQLTFVRDSPGHAYREVAGQLDKAGGWARAFPPGAPGGGKRLRLQRAMALCDAATKHVAGSGACAGFSVQTDGAPLAADGEYRIDFRTLGGAKLTPAHMSATKASAEWVSMVWVSPDARADPKPKPPPEKPKPKAMPKNEMGGRGDARWEQTQRGARNREQDFHERWSQQQRERDRQNYGGTGFNAFGGPPTPPRQYQQRRPTPPPPPPQSPRRDYYKILNLKKGASAREVKKAYHAGAKKWHPDKNRQPGQEARLEKAERNFKLIARAYEVLSDEAQRRDYDRGVDVDDELYKKRAAAAESGGYHQATGRRKKR